MVEQEPRLITLGGFYYLLAESLEGDLRKVLGKQPEVKVLFIIYLTSQNDIKYIFVDSPSWEVKWRPNRGSYTNHLNTARGVVRTPNPAVSRTLRIKPRKAGYLERYPSTLAPTAGLPLER